MCNSSRRAVGQEGSSVDIHAVPVMSTSCRRFTPTKLRDRSPRRSVSCAIVAFVRNGSALMLTIMDSHGVEKDSIKEGVHYTAVGIHESHPVQMVEKRSKVTFVVPI